MFVLCLISFNAKAQGELHEERELHNYNENSFGISLNSSGWGLDYRFSKRINHRNRYFFSVDYSFVKDPKEIKVINPYFESQKKFVYGKTYSFHQIRAGIGWQKTLFEKRDKGSISINYILSAGPVLGIAKPIYYEIVDSTETIGNIQYYYASEQLLDIDNHSASDIISKSAFYKGLAEIELKPGIFIKTGVSFDFSNNVLRTNTLEIGASIDTYLRPVEIMANNSKYFFWTIYLEYRFGSKYNANLHRDARKEARKNR
ncbi:MAG TPA: hypothetical protein PLO05_07020 [Bacteroidales bacterium]|nr:hypothetical protein [Bacteroidales bacterium]